MKRHSPTVHRILASAIVAALLPGCSGSGAVMSVTPKEGVIRPKKTVTAPVQLAPLPAMKTNSFTSTTAGGNLTGTVSLEAIDESYFANSAAPYRVASTPTTLGNAMITLSTLGEDLYTQNGDVIDGLTGLTGAFTMSGQAPKDAPYVVNATFVQSHRLSAFALPDGSGNVSNLKIDEASSAIVEMARWQLANLPAGQETAMSALYTNTFALLAQMGLATDGGNIPNVEALKVGAGHVLRNLYVETFGGKIGATGGDANANLLSDTWTTLLGFRPLALTRVAGNGGRGFDQGNDRDAKLVPMMAPIDAVADHLGNVWITEQDSSSLRFIAASNQAGFWGYPGAMTAGSIYTVGGVQNSDSDITTYNDTISAFENDDSTPDSLMSNQPKLFTPTHLVVQRVGMTNDSNVFFTSRFGNRVFFIPGGAVDNPVSAYGRNFKAGRLYVLAGNATVGDPAQADNVAANAFGLNAPTGLAQDSAGNLYLLDSAEGEIRVILAADGKIHNVNLREPDGVTAFLADGGMDLKVRESGGSVWLYVADTNHHRVVRANLGAVGSIGGAGAVNVGVVMGVKDEPGYIRAGLNYPDILDVSKALPEVDARLNAPSSLTFDGAGNMIVADKGRIHMLEAAAVDPAVDGDTYVIAGGLDTRFITGDARLGYLPDTAGVSYDPVSQNVLLTDRKENVVRKLWTARGTR